MVLDVSLPLLLMSLLASLLANNDRLQCTFTLRPTELGDGPAITEADEIAVLQSDQLALWRDRVEVQRIGYPNLFD